MAQVLEIGVFDPLSLCCVDFGDGHYGLVSVFVDSGYFNKDIVFTFRSQGVLGLAILVNGNETVGVVSYSDVVDVFRCGCFSMVSVVLVPKFSRKSW